MTYHVTCPFSGQKFYRQHMNDMRRFVFSMMSTRDCDKRIRIMDGKTMIGSMWKEGGHIWYQTKGTRVHSIVHSDGTTRRL